MVPQSGSSTHLKGSAVRVPVVPVVDTGVSIGTVLYLKIPNHESILGYHRIFVGLEPVA